MVENELLWKGKTHVIFNILKKYFLFFFFFFFFLYLKKKRKIGGIGGRGREPVMYYGR